LTVHTPLLLASALIEIRPGMIIWTLITFAIVAFVLRWKAWGPILSVVDEREKQIQNAIESAKRERAEAEKLLAEQKTAAAEQRRELAEQMKRSMADVEKMRETQLAEARKQAEAAKLEAQRAIDDQKAKAIAEIKSMTADLAIEVASKLIGEKLDEPKQRKLAEQYIDQLGAQPAARSQPTV
jgi:F-type H+-transporting ATPase subunit b